MERLFNHEIINMLRVKNRTAKYQDILYQDGDKYIFNKRMDNLSTEVGTALGKPIESSSADPLIPVYPEKSTVSTKSDSESSMDLRPNFRSSSSKYLNFAKGNKYPMSGELENLLLRNKKSYDKPERVTRLRSVLGPFPDEPFLSVLDKVLFYVNGIFGGRIDELKFDLKEEPSEVDTISCDLFPDTDKESILS